MTAEQLAKAAIKTSSFHQKIYFFNAETPGEYILTVDNIQPQQEADLLNTGLKNYGNYTHTGGTIKTTYFI